MRRVSFVLLLFAFLAAGCGGGSSVVPTPTKSVALNEEFTLSADQTARVAGEELSVTFQAVTQDSRCPINAMCVSAGNAAVQINVAKTGQANALLSLGDDSLIRQAVYAPYAVEFVDLTPLPQAGRVTPLGEYILRLRVVKK